MIEFIPTTEDPYGVPCGAVPRLVRHGLPAAAKEALGITHGDAIQQAVDDYLLMERKAKAWDEVTRMIHSGVYTIDGPQDLDAVWRSVHPAQTRSTG